MPELDVLADTEFRERAVAAVEKFIAAHGCPVARSQIAGLRQIAAHEPRLLPDFAGKQKLRADKRYADSNQRNEHYAHESRFWELIVNLCNGTQPKHAWSLAQAREQALPADHRIEKQAPGARLSKEEQAALKQRKEDREGWLRRWDQDYYRIFFQRFCAHYLYRMPLDSK